MRSKKSKKPSPTIPKSNYVGVRFDAKLEKKFIKIINELHKINIGPTCPNYWEKLSEHHSNHSFIKEWAEVDGCNFIPFGAIHQIPWGFQICSSLNESVWSVYCAVNDEKIIPIFLSKVLRKIIAEPVTVWLRKEDWKEDKSVEIKKA